MGQQFYKGRTNNHLTWVMVDATDFATPESALSAAMTIKIHGKTRGATTTAFVSSGTGSLTNDIQHVGASATGIYTIALVKADLSDASAAWYDQYIITLAGTGAAQQVLVVDGGIDASALSAYQSRLSNIESYLVALSDNVSNAYSAAILGASNASEAQSHATLAASRILLVQSRLSDYQSATYASDISEIISMLTVIQSIVSDIESDVRSDIKSAIAGITLTLTASDISDIASATAAAVNSDLKSQASDLHSDLRSYLVLMSAALSDAHSAAILGASNASEAQSHATLAASRVLLVQSRLSDYQSATYASDISDIVSMLTQIRSQTSNINSATVASPDLSDIGSAVLVALSDAFSDIKSAVAATNPTASDIASVVWTNTPGAAAASRILRILSDASLAPVGASRILLVQSRLSDYQSAVYASDISDIRSMLTALSGMISDVYSLTTANSDASSNIYSLLSDLHSDVGVISDIVSNLNSGVNVLRINGTTVTGDGNATPWGPA